MIDESIIANLNRTTQRNKRKTLKESKGWRTGRRENKGRPETKSDSSKDSTEARE